MAKFSFMLYGSDIDIVDANSQPKDLVALSELVQSDIGHIHYNCYGVYPRPTWKIDTTEYLNDFEDVTKVARMKYSMKVKPYIFPSTNTGEESYYDLSVLTKKYHWLYFPTDYYLIPDGLLVDPLQAVSVNLVGMNEPSDNIYKHIELTFTRRYPA